MKALRHESPGIGETVKRLGVKSGSEAVGYVLKQWQPLSVFTTDGTVALHNNFAEQEMKRQALNRKNS